MTQPLHLHELTPSPNSLKVRLGLGYKGLAYERHPVDIDGLPGDRSVPLELTGQPRLPVLRHGDTVLFDSGAILRYLDANFRDAPRLVPEDYGAFGRMEEWEHWCRDGLGRPIGAVFQQMLGGHPDPAVVAAANEEFRAATGKLEEALAEADYLAGTSHPTIADLTCASRVHLALANEAEAAQSPLTAAIRSALVLGEGRERTRAWAEALFVHDGRRAELAGA